MLFFIVALPVFILLFLTWLNRRVHLNFLASRIRGTCLTELRIYFRCGTDQTDQRMPLLTQTQVNSSAGKLAAFHHPLICKLVFRFSIPSLEPSLEP